MRVGGVVHVARTRRKDDFVVMKCLGGADVRASTELPRMPNPAAIAQLERASARTQRRPAGYRSGLPLPRVTVVLKVLSRHTVAPQQSSRNGHLSMKIAEITSLYGGLRVDEELSWHRSVRIQ